MNNLLENIESQLRTVSDKVYYGIADKQVKDFNYIVFRRYKTTGLNDKPPRKSQYYKVYVVNENYIPEGTEEAVIDAMESIKGLKLAADDVTYAYDRNPNTGATIELLELTFVKAMKRA